MDQGEVQGRKEGDRVGRHQAGAVPGRVQDEAGEPVDRLVAGDHRAPVVGDEPGAARPPGEIADPHQSPVRGFDHRFGQGRCLDGIRCFSRVRRLGRLRRLGCEPGSVRHLMTAPGPRAPSRHARTSPPRASHPCHRRLVFDGRREVIGRDRSPAERAPFRSPVHSERLPGRVNRGGRMDTPLGGGTEGDSGAAHTGIPVNAAPRRTRPSGPTRPTQKAAGPAHGPTAEHGRL